MKKAKIYKPTKTAMQSGLKKFDKWILEYITDDPTINPLMGWESSTDTFSELKMNFTTKEKAIEYAEKNKIKFELIEPKERKIVKKSYSDNFIK
jgi:hypothetical protein|tara:strand:+ start:1504 stop:1785 length:282 start_codon:yes stop_codon:yes gene_type:complete